jgi:positive regulator of sigma E activity
VKYAEYLRVAWFVFCGGLVGGVAGYALFHILVANDMIGRGKDLAGIFDYLVALAVFPLAGFILGELGGLLVARRTGQQQRNRQIDQHSLLKQLLSDPDSSTNGLNPSQSP